MSSQTALSLTGSGRFDLNGRATTVRSLTDTSGTSIALTNTSLTVAQAGGSTFGGVLSGTGGLTKSEAGTLDLTGVNSYTGATSVTGGTLFVNGSLANTAVTVADGATLGGGGTIAGVTTILSGAHLAPGNSPGTLTFSGGLTLAGGAVIDFQLGGASDLIRVTGGTLRGPSEGVITFNLSDAGGFAAGSYTLFDYSAVGVTTSSFDLTDFRPGTTIAGYIYTLGFNGSALTLNATLVPVPEPATWAAGAGGAALVFASLRRRKRRMGAAERS